MPNFVWTSKSRGLVLTFTGKLPKTLEEARAITLEKWQTIVDGLVNATADLVISGGSTCGYCMMFLNHSCKGCPVAERTGRSGCKDTPFDAFLMATDDGEPRLPAARAELEFLLSLDPKVSVSRAENEWGENVLEEPHGLEEPYGY